MTLLSSLPSRASADDQVNIAGFYMALEGVTRHGLQTATKQIMQGSLGHAFLPSPPELRQECDKVMKPILEARARDSYERRILKEMAADNTRAKWTPESRARVTAKWEATKAKQRLDNAAEETRSDQYDTSPEASMARLKQAAEANGKEFNLDNLKNAPSDTFKQAGRAA
ncbi:hypothetical protein [Ochrobactrum sp. Marseille-Q0166]|uniref:hypothetical protein n=1 Tax=Ochrobactrum sp. Marseille-Q0166 TaxID=2761105 RepID=UPI001654E933|nr:hypothetical protein [Ochrobactrum sp. Marseille-Q0166]MBC8718800.1 hypothetical protein [Ochrobactrum sp. Marseille-Q0166]